MTDDPRIDPADLRNVRFPGSSRRYDARSVDQFLETVATRIAATNDYVDELRRQLDEVPAAASSAPAPAPSPSDLSLLDDDALVRLVGEETASVLSTARRAAEEIRSKAEESASRMIREATAEADRLAEEARTRASELTTEAAEVHARATAEAQEAAARIRAEAAAEAERAAAERRAAAEELDAALRARREAAAAEVEQVLEAAREEGRGMVAEAREVRSRILDDLQRRRDAARAQVERLLDGRERLLGAYAAVRENLDDVMGELADALPVPAEPDLPDGFVGAVGTEAPGVEGPGAHDPGGADGTTSRADAEPDGAPEQDGTEPDGTEPDGTEADDASSPDGDPEPHGTVSDHDPLPDDTVEEDDIGPLDAPIEVESTDGAEPEPEPDDTRAPASPGGAASRDEHAATEVGPAAPLPPAAVEDEPVESWRADDVAPPADADEPVEVRVEEGPEGGVDELFARLRAEREQSVAKAHEVLAAEAPAVGDAGDAGDEAGQDRAGEPAGDVDRVPAEFLADEESLARRAEALGPLADRLHRALKRRLADEQNELLDLLRRSGSIDPDDLLPDGEEQVRAYARIAEKHLAQAAGAGAGSGDASKADVAELAEALGRNLVEPFRRRVQRAAGDIDDADELDERLRALYREWKAQHVTPVADDGLLSAYARGTYAAAGGRGTLRWLIDPSQGPCPDAQDNALAGAVAAGEAFPTGDSCPQAHPGCRCLLVASEA